MKWLDSGNPVASSIELSRRRSVATWLPPGGAFGHHLALSDHRRRELGSNDEGAPQ